MSKKNDAPLALDRPDTVRSIRDVLDRAAYNVKGIPEVLDTPDAATVRLGRADIPRALRRTSAGKPLDIFFRLFIMGMPVELDAARRAVQPMTLEEWVEVGLISLDGGSAHPTVFIRPFEHLLMVSDLSRKSELDRNHVIGFSGTSRQLAQMTVRRPSRHTLDLGTGNGNQALLAAGHSESVLALDLNPRAVNYAAFNAQLNGLPRIRCLQGDLFAPAAGQKFDLIVANPPFIVAPESRYLYRDSGLRGDGISERVVREAPEYLEEGGDCQVLCNWVQLAGQDASARLKNWVAGSGCDAWVIHFETKDVARYASQWIGDAEGDDSSEAFAQHFENWMAYYEQERIEAISYGLITLRRAGGKPNWFRYDDTPKLNGPCGDSIVRGFELRDFLETVREDEALLNTCLRLSPDVRWEQQLKPSDDSWAVTEARLQLVSSLAYAGRVDPHTFGLVTRCRGRQTLGQILSDMAASMKKDVADVAPTALPVVRQLIEQGFLLPAEPGQDS